jgi:mRNA-degrading endonuclease RelE of RelBE toxin-antitoxin system
VEVIIDAVRTQGYSVYTIKNPYHCKPLRYDLKGLRRVHLEKSFVLVFEIDGEEKMVRFLDLRHHDEIYRKR